MNEYISVLLFLTELYLIRSLESRPMFEMSKKQFMYQCTMHALQGSFANPAAQPSIASMVRAAETLWRELKAWEESQQPQGPMAEEQLN